MVIAAKLLMVMAGKRAQKSLSAPGASPPALPAATVTPASLQPVRSTSASALLYPDGSMPTPPAYMAHDPDKFWYAQVYSALCDCGHVLKAQLHRYFTSDDSDSGGAGVRP